MRVGLTTNPRVLRISECLLEDGKYLQWSALSYGVQGYPPQSEAENRLERHAALRVTRYVTVTALLRFWGYANEHAKGEFIAGVFPEDIDEIVGVPGFADAIEAAGWVEFDASGGLSMPNFHEHNTSADARSGGAERQKRYREKHKEAGGESDDKRNADRNVTRDVTVTPREEKKREEKKEQKKPRASGAKKQCFTDWANTLAGPAVPADDPLFGWAQSVGIPREWIAIAWWIFEARYDEKDTAYSDWRAVFRKAVREDWLKAWRQTRSGEWELTTAGIQAQREMAA